MIGDKILERKVLTLTEAKDILAERKKDKELTYEQDMTLKYAKTFSKLTPKKAEKLLSELMKLEGMTEELAVKVADILPTEKEVFRLLLPKDTELSDETIAQAMELAKKYSPAKKPGPAKKTSKPKK